ncbi:MAG: PIG-L family deacetylase [Ktedonobacteraceae bacterium]
MSESEQNKVVMVIVAHEDDAEFACAGTIAIWVREGWDAYYVICADGGSGGPDDATDVSPTARQRIVETRKHEQRNAGTALGLKNVYFLGYPDGQLEASLEMRRDIVRLLRQRKPSRVICQSPDRSWTPSYILQRDHRDHLIAGRATLEAIYPASQNPWDFPELMQEGLQPHKVSEVYIAGAPVQNFAIDITPVIDIKMQALRAHVSQFENGTLEVEQMIRDFGKETGKKYGYAYAEEFHLVKNG